MHRRLYALSEQIEFEEDGDKLPVRGQVPKFYLKQILQSALKSVDGVGRIDNQVEVSRSSKRIGF